MAVTAARPDARLKLLDAALSMIRARGYAATTVDALCAATYKWQMSGGTAFLYVRKASLARMQPPFYHFERDDYAAGQFLPTTHMYPFDPPGSDIIDRASYFPRQGTAGGGSRTRPRNACRCHSWRPAGRRRSRSP